MAPVVGEDVLPVDIHQQHGGVQHLVPAQKGINLSLLVDFLLQKTYHDLQILSELLPRKSDIERKIEIIQFATKARQQFIRFLALVKWAASAERVDKCQSISSFLDQKNAYFIDTADTLVRVARETLVQARLPNFSLPTAVDVLTTGTFNRLPKCIKTKIIADDAINPSDKERTIKRLNEVLQNRLVSSKIPSEFTKIKIADGKVVVGVDNEFEVSLMLMGDGEEVPWRLLNIEFLMEDYETSDGKSLVHGMQIHYIHQIVQSRLLVEDEPLCDLYKTLHYFCISLQLEVLFTQTKRLIGERWGDFVKIEDYSPGTKLKLSYCRSPSLTNNQTQKTTFPSFLITSPDNDSNNNLVLKHTPTILNIELDSNTDNFKTFHDEIHLSTKCLSIEKIFSVISNKYTIYLLNELNKELHKDAYLPDSSTIDTTKPCLNIKLFTEDCSNNTFVISVVQKTGNFVVENKLIKPNQKLKLQNLLATDVTKFIEEFHAIRVQLYLELCYQEFSLLPFIVSRRLPFINISTHKLSKLPKTRLYLQFQVQTRYCVVLTFEIDTDRNFKTTFYLLKLLQQDNNKIIKSDDAPTINQYIAGSLSLLNTEAILNLRNLIYRKRKVPSYRPANKKIKIEENKDIEIHSATSVSSVEHEHIRLSSVKAINYITAVTMRRLPFIEITEQLSKHNVIYNQIEKLEDFNFKLEIIDFSANKDFTINSKDILISCQLRLSEQLSSWKVVYNINKPFSKCCKRIECQHIVFTYAMEQPAVLVDNIIKDWQGLCKLYNYAQNVDDIFQALNNDLQIRDFIFKSFDGKSLVFTYGPAHQNKMVLTHSYLTCKYDITFGETGTSRQKSPHHLIKKNLSDEFNHHHNLQYVLKIIHNTYTPLSSIASIPILPALGISNRVNFVNNNFTFIANSSTHVKIIYRNHYILDVSFMETAVVIRDGTLYRTDSTKAMRGFITIPQLSALFQMFTDKIHPNTTGFDYPFTPGGSEFDQQNEHYGPASHDSNASMKDRSIRSPAVVISSPSQPYSGSHFMAPSPGNAYSVPSPGTFVQPSPASIMNISAMSPNTWPGSPPVQGSPRTGGKQMGSVQQSRQLLTSINVSHSPLPAVLSHTEFVRLLTPKDNDNPVMVKSPKLCPLEKFFGSVMLRSHLLRVLRTDDTLKLEKNEHGTVIFCATGKSGFETGLQYSVRLNEQIMDSLLLKVTPLMGHENNWQHDDLRTLEQFFESKVVCAPYKICALTAFARILGTQPKIIKDFIRIMKLELQTDWKGFLFKVEWCLIIPPGDKPSIAVPGTPAVMLKNKNLIFLQLTEVKNENNTVTVTVVHDVRTNTVQHVKFPKLLQNDIQEPITWATRARQSFDSLLQRISEQISKKDCPIYCAVYTVLMNLKVN